MKAPLALLFYCFLFSTLFVLFYSFISQESRLEIITRKDLKINFEGDKIAALEDVESALSDARFEELFLGSSFGDRVINQGCPLVPQSFLKYLTVNYSNPLTEQEKLLAMGKQTKPIPMADLFSTTMIATLTKIGEGAFADVFGCQQEGWKKLAIKIIPIEGNFKYNDEPQNTFKTIQTEAVVSLMAVAVGKYPDYLLEAWDDYDYRKNSDNDRPDVFGEEQLYVVFLAEDSGNQLGSYVYHSLDEAISILQQVTATLAIGEAALEFEHRDLHRGNVLVKRTREEYVYFRLDGVEYSIKTHGVKASIVDYTLSRVKQDHSDCVSYVDLKKMPWLFKGKGDIQFDVYRDVKNHTKGKWSNFYPYTNVLWINYIATKMRIKAKLKGPSSKHWKALMLPFVHPIKKHRSARDVFLNVFAPQALSQIFNSTAHIKTKTSGFRRHPLLPTTQSII